MPSASPGPAPRPPPAAGQRRAERAAPAWPHSLTPRRRGGGPGPGRCSCPGPGRGRRLPAAAGSGARRCPRGLTARPRPPPPPPSWRRRHSAGGGRARRRDPHRCRGNAARRCPSALAGAPAPAGLRDVRARRTEFPALLRASGRGALRSAVEGRDGRNSKSQRAPREESARARSIWPQRLLGGVVFQSGRRSARWRV